jgi:hypothetical protein
MAKLAPTVGQWYEDITAYRFFEIIAIDESTGIVSIQFLEGDIDELDFETLSQIAVRQQQQPENWRNELELDTQSPRGADNICLHFGVGDALGKIELDSLFGWDDF